MTKILLNTGPSARGWHRLEAFIRCPRLFALGYGRSGESEEMAQANRKRFPPTKQLVRGSMAHAGLAHLYARLKASREGADPEIYYRPSEAVSLVAATFGDMGIELLNPVLGILNAYVARYAGEVTMMRAVGVETPLSMEVEHFYKGVRALSIASHSYTARADLIHERADGKVWIMDHKCVGKIESKSIERYALSGQFLGLQHLGWATYGECFGGVELNLLSMKNHDFLRKVIDPAPWALEHFLDTVRYVEEGIARFEMTGEAPGSFSEFTCMTPYGKCPAFHMCRFGEEMYEASSTP
jgi:hypothetical protein